MTTTSAAARTTATARGAHRAAASDTGEPLEVLLPLGDELRLGHAEHGLEGVGQTGRALRRVHGPVELHQLALPLPLGDQPAGEPGRLVGLGQLGRRRGERLRRRQRGRHLARPDRLEQLLRRRLVLHGYGGERDVVGETLGQPQRYRRGGGGRRDVGGLVRQHDPAALFAELVEQLRVGHDPHRRTGLRGIQLGHRDRGDLGVGVRLRRRARTPSAACLAGR